MTKEEALKILRYEMQTHIATEVELHIAMGMAIEALQTARPTGHWIKITKGAIPEQYVCSNCGRLIEDYESGALLDVKYPFCHCGADMRGGNHEAD